MSIDDLPIGDHIIKPGETRQLEIPVAKLYTDTDVFIPVHVIRSKKPGPIVFVSAAVHGDELNGVEIVRRLIQLKSLKISAGSLVLIPMVNVYGVLNQSRYMPDRRDLNRSFPGSKKGSLAGRVAHIFLEEIIKHCDYGIDLHTGAIHRSNLPQIRANLSDPETEKLAMAFGASVVLNANLRDGSLRYTGVESGTRILLYEAGQALRFDELSIRVGVRGVMNVIAELGLIKLRRKNKSFEPYIANDSAWVRANVSGIVRDLKKLGDRVRKGDALAEIGGPFGEVIDTVIATKAGIIIGKQNIPLAQEGDAMYHIAFFEQADAVVAENIEAMHENMSSALPFQDQDGQT
jgi:predicted deacylase